MTNHPEITTAPSVPHLPMQLPDATAPVTSPARGGPDSARGRVCICTTPERESGRYFHACLAHQRPATSGVCHHTVDEGCTGHGDF